MEANDLRQRVRDLREEVRRSSEHRELIDNVAESMAPDARIGLFNCYGAEDKRFFNNVGELFLHRNGGTVTGTTGVLWTVSTHPLWEWITDRYDTGLLTTGEWKTRRVLPATHCNGYRHKPTCTCGWGGPR